LNQVILPLSAAAASLFAGCIFVSLILARKLPLKLCVVQGGDELRVFVSLGRVSDERVKCFSTVRELRAFAGGSGARVSGVRDAVAMVIAVRKAMLTVAALGGLGLAISVALAVLSLALGA